MAMVLDAFVGICVDKMTGLITEKVVMVLGVKDDLKRLQRRMTRIHKFLEAAERRRLDDPTLDHWVAELKDVAYDADDIIDLCRVHGARLLNDHRPSPPLRRLACFNFLFSCLSSVPHRYQIGESIRTLNDKLEEIDKDRVLLNLEESSIRGQQIVTTVNIRQTSSMAEFDVVGEEIEEATNKLVKLIVDEQGNTCRVSAITGMGGIGKTTLAQKVFNNKKIMAEFQVRIWVCVSQTYNEIDVLQQVIRAAGGHHGEARIKSELQPILKSAVFGKSVFLVLDDVWRADVWLSLLRNPLRSAEAMVRVLVTTRDENVAREMGAVHIHRVQQLSNDASWAMLCRKVFNEGQQEEISNVFDIGLLIVARCCGLPLAIKAIAGVLSKKGSNRKEWEKVLNNEAWSMSRLPEELRGALYLSFDDLPSPLKQCFVYCSLFPEDESLSRSDLVRLWVAEGFVKEQGDAFIEDTAKEYYGELIRRNLLQPDPMHYDESECIMHDLMRSLAKFLSQDETFTGNVTNTAASPAKLRRLAVENQETISTVASLVVEQKCLRTLLAFHGTRLFDNSDQLAGLTRLRVLRINSVDINRLPNSIGDLIHLRYLDLDDTDIEELPESIGSLTNLQFLNLRACEFLTKLPDNIMQLHNIRRLGLYNTPLRFIPKGIKNLGKLNDLSGFVVADPGEQSKVGYSSLGELGSLHQLRMLSIAKLERAQKGDLSLANLSHLVDLKLFYSKVDALTVKTEDISRVENVLEELCPPHCLEELCIRKYFGHRYPTWMQSPSFRAHFPFLTTLELSKNKFCTQLPPAGELPQLKLLFIKRADAVKRIGPEFLGIGTHPAIRTAFPKLEILKLYRILHLEEWTFGETEEAQVLPNLVLLPRLSSLEIEDCPMLASLPKGLEQSSMKRLYIAGALSLKAVSNLPNLTELVLIGNASLETISHLPALQVLAVISCPAFKLVEKVDALQRLNLVDHFMEAIPEWLVKFLRERKAGEGEGEVSADDFLLEMLCTEKALWGCLKGGSDWPIVETIPSFIAYDNVGKGFMRYTRSPFYYYTNVIMAN
ncbi:hypothetical protein HPP92_026311 [Vanilla planifolia]|uniref:Disease resistance protein RGA3 n=1 Tax=Vanilla planifolia TaxID=51239 RepID=A0A835U7H0_VANPL|nr:hypothetical protein HPP92_026537 [Vanilla planifolia]KAG0451286.1 hypothetical protein HPP92_026311 [Vanilla planifolia]